MNNTEIIQHLLYRYLSGTAQAEYFESKFENIVVANSTVTFDEVNTIEDYDKQGELIEHDRRKSHTVSMLEIMAWVLYQGEK